MLYHVVDTETNQTIVSYDIAVKANRKADELNNKYQTTRYQVK